MRTSRFRVPALLLATLLQIGAAIGAEPPAPPPDSSPSQSAALAAAQKISNPVTYHIEMTTNLVIPQQKQVSELRIYHALPVDRSWSETATGIGATEIQFAPASGVQEYTKVHASHHTVWREKADFMVGTSHSFTTKFTVLSVDRELQPSAIHAQWPTNFTPPTDIEPTIRRVADEIRQRFDPVSSVIQFSKLIQRDIHYDASVPYRADDVASTVANQRGHCGHRFNVFAQLCRRAGIPVRRSHGLVLKNADGISELSRLNPGWTNIHAWAEVYFAEVGWVEVEPSYGEKAFAIPSRFIQNNKWFQNCAVWVCEDGKMKMPSWSIEDGDIHSSEYQISNIIKFSATP